MKRGICYVVGACGACEGLFSPCVEDLVIAADGGLKTLLKAKIRADIVIGDFDSLGEVPLGAIKLSDKKDDTDMLAAIRVGIEKGFEVFHLYCGVGGRLSHTIANIQCLEFLSKRGMCGYLFGDGMVMTVVGEGEHNFSNRGGYFSVFALDEVVRVTLEGVKYPLFDYEMRRAFPIGVSNEIVVESAKVKAKNGCLLIVFDR